MEHKIINSKIAFYRIISVGQRVKTWFFSRCCEYLEDLKPEHAGDMRTVLLYLHVLVSFTGTGTWAILRSGSSERLKPGLNRLCESMMGQLFHKGFYLTLRVNQTFFLTFTFVFDIRRIEVAIFQLLLLFFCNSYFLNAVTFSSLLNSARSVSSS